MREPRIYVSREVVSGGRATVQGEQAHHLVSVLRKKPGDVIVLFDGEGTEWRARIVRIAHDLVVARTEEKEIHGSARRAVVALYVAVPKGRRFDLIVEKATELGADSITPVLTARSVVKLDSHNVPMKVERWRRIAIAACKQCRRATLPEINAPLDFASAAQGLTETVFPIMARCLPENPPMYDVLTEIQPQHKEIRLYIGPEGGFSREETELVETSGMRFAALGENILRTETAAIASLAVVRSFLDHKLTRSTPDIGPGE